MKSNSNEITDMEFQRLLKNREVSVLSKDLSASIMNEIYGIEKQRAGFNKYMILSWFFIAVALVLSVVSIGSFSFMNTTFSNYFDQLIPGLYDYFLIGIITLIASLLLYQLNQLLSYYFRKVELVP